MVEYAHTTTVDNLARVLIPKGMRNAAGIKLGEMVTLKLTENGDILITKANTEKCPHCGK